MQFGSCSVSDETTGLHWICRAGEAQGTINCPFPVALPLGHAIGSRFLCSNNGVVAVSVRTYIAIVDPDGLTRVDGYNPATGYDELDPGVGYYSEYIGGAVLDKQGLWLIYGLLEFDGGSLEKVWPSVNASEEGGGDGGNGGGNGGGGEISIPWGWIIGAGVGLGAIIAIAQSRKEKK